MSLPRAPRATRHFPADRPVLPEWTRFAWTSEDERGWWDPYIKAAERAVVTLERHAVATGLRDAAWTTCPAQDLPGLTAWAESHDMGVLPRRIVATSPSGYSAGSREIRDGDPWEYFVLLTKRGAAIPRHGDDESLGASLGYPPCCRRFFAETWAAGQVDTTYDQYRNTGVDGGSANGATETNLLWRWLGVRWVFHLPCAHTCEATQAIGGQMRTLAKTLGFHEEIAVIDEVLQWPTQWSAVNGISIITGPCVKVSTRTDWSPERRSFTREGRYTTPDPTLWLDNGFLKPRAMRVAHDIVNGALKEHAPRGARVSDLGCGNGLMLQRLKTSRPDLAIGGIDVKEDAIRRARLRGGTWTLGRIQDGGWTTWAPTVAVLSVNRLSPGEMSPAESSAVRGMLSKIDHVFVSAYSDNLLVGNLDRLCEQAGLPRATVVKATPDVAVGIIHGHDISV